MSISYSRSLTVLIDNQQARTSYTLNTNGIVQQNPTVAAPKTGTLTTYTDANTATLTMSASHGITTGAKFDLYWAGGYRYNCTAGTVSGNTVPFTGGTGSAIPTVIGTAVSAMVPQSYNLNFVWADLQALVCSSQKTPYPVRSIIHFIKEDGTTEITFPFVVLDGVSDYVWDVGITSKPLIVVTSVTLIKISHDDSTNPQPISVSAMYAN